MLLMVPTTPTMRMLFEDHVAPFNVVANAFLSLYDDPDETDDLRQCIQNAKDEYQSCVEKCTS